MAIDSENRLERALRLNKQIRVAGVDDAPFPADPNAAVPFSVIICSNTRFEGMLWSSLQRDGLDATDALIKTVQASKFWAQLHVLLIDGIAMGGFNVVDLPRLSTELKLPSIAVMRKPPDLAAIDQALTHLTHTEQRRNLIQRAGPIHQQPPFVFQNQGCSPETAALCLQRVTDQGHVPEALRLAHLIGSAIQTGQSSNRA